MPAGAGLAARFGALQFDALKIEAAIFCQWGRKRRPHNVVFLVNVPVVALAADEAQLPAILRPVGRSRPSFRRVGIRQANARCRGHGAIWVLASYDGLQIHRVLSPGDSSLPRESAARLHPLTVQPASL